METKIIEDSYVLGCGVQCMVLWVILRRCHSWLGFEFNMKRAYVKHEPILCSAGNYNNKICISVGSIGDQASDLPIMD
jgi:hypothetical protein